MTMHYVPVLDCLRVLTQHNSNHILFECRISNGYLCDIFDGSNFKKNVLYLTHVKSFQIILY